MPRTSYLHKPAQAASDGQAFTFSGGADIDFQPTAQVYAVLRATDASSVNIAGVEVDDRAHTRPRGRRGDDPQLPATGGPVNIVGPTVTFWTTAPEDAPEVKGYTCYFKPERLEWRVRIFRQGGGRVVTDVVAHGPATRVEHREGAMRWSVEGTVEGDTRPPWLMLPLGRLVRASLTVEELAKDAPWPDIDPPTACPCAEWVKFGACPHTQRGPR